MKVSFGDIDAIALGGAFLATGGGGDLLVGQLMTREVLKEYGPVELITLDELDDEATVICVGGVGAPTIMLEKLSNGKEPGWALEALEAYIGKKADALIAMEAGGLNALVPFIPAAQRKLPVLDADGMGRAFPELQMESFAIYGVSATPLALASDLHDTAVISNVRSSEVAEKLVRDFAIIAGGGHCISAEHVMDGATAKRASVPGTISLCRTLGRLLAEKRGDAEGFMEGLAECMADTHYGESRKLFEGKVMDVTRRIERGFDIGEIKLEAFGDEAAKNRISMTIAFQNEYLVAWLERGDTRRPVCTTPDLICMVDNETLDPITAERVRYGQRVVVIGIGAPDVMRTDQALKAVAPRCFGIDLDYVRIEDITAD